MLGHALWRGRAAGGWCCGARYRDSLPRGRQTKCGRSIWATKRFWLHDCGGGEVSGGGVVRRIVNRAIDDCVVDNRTIDDSAVSCKRTFHGFAIALRVSNDASENATEAW